MKAYLVLTLKKEIEINHIPVPLERAGVLGVCPVVKTKKQGKKLFGKNVKLMEVGIPSSVLFNKS